MEKRILFSSKTWKESLLDMQMGILLFDHIIFILLFYFIIELQAVKALIEKIKNEDT